MPIKRITNRINLLKSGKFIAVYGNVLEEDFITPKLEICNLPQILWNFLKDSGYQRVIFFDIKEKIYSYDEESIRLCYQAMGENKISNKTHIRQSKDVRPRGKFNLLNRRKQEDSKREEGLSIVEGNGVFKIPVQSDTNLLQILDGVMYDSHIKSAVIFTQFENIVMERQTSYARLINTMVNWGNQTYENQNKCFVILHDINILANDDNNRNQNHIPNFLLNLFNRNNERLNLQNKLFIENPHQDEIGNLVHRHRLLKNKELDWLNLDKIIRWLEMDDKNLRRWQSAFQEVSIFNAEKINEILEQKRKFNEKNALERLNDFIGLEGAKKVVISHVKRIARQRKNPSRYRNTKRMHMVFQGNPGTGKTTFARLVAEIYRELEVLSKGHFTETSRANLVAGYVGQTAMKTEEVCQRAKGGVLLVDEAYMLKRNSEGGNDFGQEAIDTLMKFMEDNKDDLCVIFTGYPKEMQLFLTSNPGLKGRIGAIINFPDYNPQDLYAIFELKRKILEIAIAPTMEKDILTVLTNIYKVRDKHFSNARVVEDFLDQLIDCLDDRCEREGIEDASEPLIQADLPPQYQIYFNTQV